MAVDASPAPVPHRPISPELVALAESHGLGTHRFTIHPKRAAAFRLVALFFFGILGLFALVIPGLYFFWLATQTPNLSRAQAARRLEIFENGLIETAKDGTPAAFRWDSMTALQAITERYANGIYVGTTYVYTLHAMDGTVRKVTDFYAEPERWGPYIQQEITRFQLPGLLDRLDQGETLRFGNLSVNRGGIATAKSGSATWAEIEQIQIRNGVLFLRKSGQKLRSWSTQAVKDVPNFFLFLALVDRIRQTG
jgi:hypothetical protein